MTFGPHPRSYAYRLSKQVRRLALRSALAAKAADGRFAVLNGLDLKQPKTRVLAGLIRELGRGEGGGARTGRGTVLLIIAAPEPVVARSAANLPHLRVLPVTALNVHDILACDQVLVTQDALARIAEAFAS